MKDSFVIVLDIGATNVRAVAVTKNGLILAEKSYANQRHPDPFLQNGLIWDVDEIWDKLAKATQNILKTIDGDKLIGVSITSFGVDGAPFNKKGAQLYPVISWACQRTEDILEELFAKIPLSHLIAISGVNHFHFNTLYKIYWLLKHKKELMKDMDSWLFMPSIISQRLCNTMYTDVSMLGTSMLGDFSGRDFSGEILSVLGLDDTVFPPLKEAGDFIGTITEKASRKFGIKAGVAVYAAGHDTQFAVFASGASIHEAVLSSGTWEILMMRSPLVKVNDETQKAGITIELDAEAPLFNPGIQWLGSGILEWIKNTLFSDVKDRSDIYDIMISEAQKVKKSGLEFRTDFLTEDGFIKGIGLQTSRGEIYLAALYALANQSKLNLQKLEELSGTKAQSLIVVGGGSKNKLWNEIREKALGIEIKVNKQTETTVLGAAMFAFAACGVYNSAQEARKAFLKNAKK